MHNVVRSGSSILTLAVCLYGGIATADDSTSLGGKIDAALSAAKSYQVDITGPGDRSGSIVVVRGVGSRYRTPTSSGVTMTYMIGTTVYQHTARGWLKFIMDPSSLATLSKSTTRHRSAEPLPDRTEGGITVGAITTIVTIVLPGLDPALGTSGSGVCTYDKGTFLLRMCTFDQRTLQYSRYDDPSLTIELPAEAKDAPVIDLSPVQPRPSP
jgi:hypothetical protein